MRTARPLAPPRVGFLPIVFQAMLVLTALDVVLTNRDLTEAFARLQAETEGSIEIVRHPLLAWIQRGVSLLLIAASLERIVSHFAMHRPVPAVALTVAYFTFWLTSVAAPGLLGAVPKVSHEYAYSLLLGLAATLSGPYDRQRILAAARNGLFLFMLAGLAVVAVKPALVLDSSYAQGLLPGVPRFAGLSAHPVMMGLLAQTALLLLWARPFERRWITVLAWMLGLGVLFLAQSKTAWLAFIISATCMLLVRRVPDTVQQVGDPRRAATGVALCLAVIGVVVALLLGILVADAPGAILGFFDSRDGAQLVSLTGRDRIWTVALEEWNNNPVFGYGPTLWDPEYRQAIAMPFATHGHNQWIDTLARAGTVGTVGLTLYFLVLAGMSLRYARATGGLSLAMFLTLALLCISEVPLLIYGYGTELFTHLLLVVVLAAAASERQRRAPVVQPAPSNFRAAL